ncbi:ATP-binding protein [bacterium]|nr:ATP-binding protein [bacterium]
MAKTLVLESQNFLAQDLSEIRISFQNFIIDYIKANLGEIDVDSHPEHLAYDLKEIFGEIIGNAVRHGTNACCVITQTDSRIVVRVSNEREEDTSDMFKECGRGLTMIKDYLIDHKDVNIVYLHKETAISYMSILIINKQSLLKSFQKI